MTSDPRARLLRATARVLLAVACAARPASATDPPGPATPAPVGASSAPATDAAPSAFASPKTLGFTLGGVGLVGVAVGSVFGALSMSAWSSATAGCGPAGNAARCVAQNPSQVTSDHDAAARDAAVSTVAFIVGGVLVVAGGAVLLTGVHHGDVGSTTVSLAPTFAPGKAGLALSGSF